MSIDDGRQPVQDPDPAPPADGGAAAPEAPPVTELPPPAGRVPALGDIVRYQVAGDDEPNTRHNAPAQLPAIVTAVWGPLCVNLKIFTDGPANTWKTSVLRGDGPGNWNFRD